MWQLFWYTQAKVLAEIQFSLNKMKTMYIQILNNIQFRAIFVGNDKYCNCIWLTESIFLHFTRRKVELWPYILYYFPETFCSLSCLLIFLVETYDTPMKYVETSAIMRSSCWNVGRCHLEIFIQFVV